MDSAEARTVRIALDVFTTQKAYVSAIFVVFDFFLYVSLVCVAVLSPSVWVKVPAVIGAGTAISMLFILGHDGAHRILVRTRWANALLTRLVFAPCLHNATLWWIEHNWTHHQFTNSAQRNSFSPMSPREFATASRLRRFVERLYRSPLGFGLYYLIERWWKHKFVPFGTVAIKSRFLAWADCLFVLGWLALSCTAVVLVDAKWGADTALFAVIWGIAAPFLVWNQLMGTTAFLQHTHPRGRWSSSSSGPISSADQMEVTALVRFPRWYDFISHNIMHHPVHHVHARIPWYNLVRAQRALDGLAGSYVIQETFSPAYIWRVVKNCQIYDYERQKWMRFAECSRTLPAKIMPADPQESPSFGEAKAH